MALVRETGRSAAEIVVRGHDHEVGALRQDLLARDAALVDIGLAVGYDSREFPAEQSALLVLLGYRDFPRLIIRQVVRRERAGFGDRESKHDWLLAPARR